MTQFLEQVHDEQCFPQGDGSGKLGVAHEAWSTCASSSLWPGEVTELQQFPKARTQRNILELCIILFKYLKNHVPASG